MVRKASYCSRECYWTANNRRKVRECRSCGKVFLATNSLVQKGFGFYCNRDCWFRLFGKARVKVKCKHCRNIFTVPVSVYKTKPKFCSKRCKDDYNRDYVARVCKKCDKKFLLPRSDLNRGRGSFCTWKCFHTYRGESSIEEMVRLQLEKTGEEFVQEKKFGRFHADFFLPQRKLAIECDGEYWHRSKSEKLRDRKKERFIESLGLTVVRFKGEVIKSSVGRCVLAVLD